MNSSNSSRHNTGSQQSPRQLSQQQSAHGSSVAHNAATAASEVVRSGSTGTISLPDDYLALSTMQTISKKTAFELEALTSLYQNVCLLGLSFAVSFVNKNAIKRNVKVSVLLCHPCLRFWGILLSNVT